MALRDLSMTDLRALIDRQLAAKAKAEADARELDELLRESLAEFMERVSPARPVPSGDREKPGS